MKRTCDNCSYKATKVVRIGYSGAPKKLIYCSMNPEAKLCKFHKPNFVARVALFLRKLT